MGASNSTGACVVDILRPRSLASALSPSIAGALLVASPFGWPLVICGTLKIVYDLTLLRMFRSVKPPEEH